MYRNGRNARSVLKTKTSKSCRCQHFLGNAIKWTLQVLFSFMRTRNHRCYCKHFQNQLINTVSVFYILTFISSKVCVHIIEPEVKYLFPVPHDKAYMWLPRYNKKLKKNKTVECLKIMNNIWLNFEITDLLITSKLVYIRKALEMKTKQSIEYPWVWAQMLLSLQYRAPPHFTSCKIK